MKKLFAAIVLAALASTTPAFSAITIEAFGTVADNSLGSGPWSGVQVGDPAHVIFQVPDFGFVIDPGHSESYDVDRPTFSMEVAGIPVGLRLTGIDVTAFVGNDFPVADSFVLGPDFIAMTPGSGYSFSFELHDSSGSAWNSASLMGDVGTYAASAFDDYLWGANDESGALAIELSSFVIVPEPASFSLAALAAVAAARRRSR